MGVAIPQIITEDRASGALVVDGSLRFAQSNTQYLTRTPSSNGDRTRWTVSLWCKRHSLGGGSGGLRSIIHTNAGSQETILAFWSDDAIFFWDYNSAYTTQLKTVGVAFRDVSSWYHIVLSVDTTQSTDTERIKLYVNNVRQIFTNVAPHGYIAQNTQTRWNSALISQISGGYYKNDCSITNIYNIDGQALDASYFGYTDPLTNTWRPKKLSSSVAFGTNGFFLPFDGSAPIGQDQSGRGNNWTPVNFGGSNTLEKATGALPILNTDGGGKVARVGVRTDSSASSLVLALPLVGIKSDFSNAVNSGSTAKTITNSNVTFVSTQSNFYGGSASFNGSNSILTTNLTADQFNDGSWTIEAWVNFSGYRTYESGIVGTSGNQYLGIILKDSTNYFRANFGTSSTPNIESTIAPIFGKWYHVAAVRDGSTGRFFVDGVQVGTVSLSTYSLSASNVVIGSYYDASTSYSPNAYIQDVRIYDGLAKYTQNFIPASTDPDILPDTPSGVAYSSNVALVPSTDGAVSFDGASDYLNLGSSADYNVGTGDFTFECFAYYNTRNDYSGIFGPYTYSTNAILIQISNSSVLRLVNPGGIDVSGTTNISNRWVHIAVSRSGTTLRGFINGIQEISTTYSSSIDFANGGAAVLGVTDVSTYLGTYDFRGFISNVHFVKGTALYTSNFTPPSAPITSVANTKLLCCKSNSSATAFDVSPGTITANGNAAATNFNPFTVNINTQRGRQSGWCTLNPTIGATQLGGSTAPTYADGNSKVSFNGAAPAAGTIGVISGKWYFEVLVNSAASSNNSTGFGIRNGLNAGAYTDFTGYFRGVRHNNSGNLTYSTSADTGTSAGAIMAAGEVYGLVYDVDNNYFALYKNGIILVSSSSSSLSGGTWFPYAFGDSSSGSHTFNFGQKPFKFPPPAGFQPLALANTPRPTIVRPDQYVGVTTYTGNGGTQSIGGLGFKPDLVWIKCRDASVYHALFDSVRGVNKRLGSNETSAEQDQSPSGLSQFLSNGFTVVDGATGGNGINGSPGGLYAGTNARYVGWAWKAGGNSNTYNINDVGYATASVAGLTAGTITPTGASVNTKSGFSIIGYTGNGTGGATISHGLQNTPSFIIIKKRTSSPGATNWRVYHSALGNTKAIFLSTTGASDTSSTYWNNTSPTSSVFSLGTDDGLNASSQTHIAYCWAEIPGFSKFGTYTGNGSADGPVIITGFKPRWILIKVSAGDTGNWWMYDSTRSSYNLSDSILHANLNLGEFTSNGLDILSNGFKIRSSNGNTNGSGFTFVYAAFAETPTQNLYGAQSNAR